MELFSIILLEFALRMCTYIVRVVVSA